MLSLWAHKPRASLIPGLPLGQTWMQRSAKVSQLIGYQDREVQRLSSPFLTVNLYFAFRCFRTRVKIKMKLNYDNKEMFKACEILSNLRSGIENSLYPQANYSFHDNEFHPPNCVLHFLVHRCPICFANGRNVFLFVRLTANLIKKSDIIAF